MRARRHRSRRYGMYSTLAAVGSIAGILGVAGAPVASADAIVAVGPHQFYVGDVNGATADAVIKVGCFGPSSTGHPLSGQTVAVHLTPPDSTKTGGYTGESADHIFVEFESAPISSAPLSLTAYDVKAAIPTDLNLPCGGPGKVVFVPAPTSSTARWFTVTVTYESSGV